MTREDVAFAFLDACETGKGWSQCAQFCHDNATFRGQSGALADISTVADYAEWMKAMFGPLPDANYELLFFGMDEKRGAACAAAVFHASHSGEGGPVPATGKTTASDYAYVMVFDGDRIAKMIKIWNDGFALKELGWT